MNFKSEFIIYIMIKEIKKSDKLNKRFKVILDNGKIFDFGLKNGSTYIDHNDKKLRDNYIKRHYNLKKEQPFIKNLIPSPALFSFYLLWGPYTTINKNIDNLNNILMNKN